jgi:hypothetical protein
MYSARMILFVDLWDLPSGMQSVLMDSRVTKLFFCPCFVLSRELQSFIDLR